MLSYSTKLLLLIILGILLIVCILWKPNAEEHFTQADSETIQRTNYEAIQNIAKIYNENLAKFNNLEIVDTIKTKQINADSVNTGTFTASQISTNRINSQEMLDISTPITFNNGIKLNGSMCIDTQCIGKDNLIRMFKQYESVPMYDVDKNNSVIYDNVFTSGDASGPVYARVAVSGDQTVGFNETTWRTSLWNGYPILNVGYNTSNVGGININVPQDPPGLAVVWIRVLNDRWAALNINGVAYGFGNIFSDAAASAARLKPDGTDDTLNTKFHKWWPVTIPDGTKNINIIGHIKGGSDGNWISGIGFSANPNNHATCTAITYHWGLNLEPTVSQSNVFYGSGDICYIKPSVVATLMVPCIMSGKDKMIYMILDRNTSFWTTNYRDVAACTLTIGGQLIERFSDKYVDSFSKYFKSKTQASVDFISAKIPSSLVNASNMVNNRLLRINISGPRQVNFREIGTYDF